MAAQHFPVVGNWYKGEDNQLFEVVAVDEEDNTIEVQYFGGEIAEFDFDAWNLMPLELVPQPDDWTGPYGELERDDLGYTDLDNDADINTISLDDLD